MRLLSFLAVLSAALSAVPAQACCIFKCFGKSAPTVTAAPTAIRTAERGLGGVGGDTPYIEIASVNSIPPDSGWDIPGDQPSANVVIVVEVDVWTAANNQVFLYVTDLGERASPAARAVAGAGIAPAGAAGVTTKHTHVKSKLKFKERAKVRAAPAPGAPRAAAATGGDSDGFWVWELTYLVDCDDGHNYTCWAEAGLYASHKVTFHTAAGPRPGPHPMPGPPDGVPPPKKK